MFLSFIWVITQRFNIPECGVSPSYEHATEHSIHAYSEKIKYYSHC